MDKIYSYILCISLQFSIQSIQIFPALNVCLIFSRFTFDKTTAATSHEKSPSKKLVALMDPPMSKKENQVEIMPRNTLKIPPAV